MSDSLISLMNDFFLKLDFLSNSILSCSYLFFEYIATIAYNIINEIYHLSNRLNGPGWSSDFLRLFQTGNRVEVTSRLNTWQYWWWFWFCFAWAYYDGFFKRILCTRNYRIFIGIYTSLRPHGKFGDFIACIIPIGWVINIVFNSNSLLKLAEWQNDTTVFNIRIRARQWYWLYYYDFKHLFELFNLPKQVGWNSWRCDGYGLSKYYSSYLTALESRSRDFANSFEYWDEKVAEIIKSNYLKKQKTKTFNETNSLHKSNNNLLNNNFNNNIYTNSYNSKCKKIIIDSNNYLNWTNIIKHKKLIINIDNNLYIKSKLVFEEISRKLFEYKTNYINLFDLVINENDLSFITKKNRKLIYDNISSDTLDSFYFDSQKSNDRFLSIKLNIDKSSFKFITKINTNNFLNLEWWDNRGLTLLLQKRLESPDLVPADFIKSTQKIDYRLSNKTGTRCYITTKSFSYTRNGKLLDITNLNVVEHNKFTRNSIVPSYHLPSQFSKRLLRVTKTFILPTLTSLNVMTNSYDVVHSWFVPGLGIKFDCVPGKSTHHLLYLEFVGFFYGQCAEICGRYHHHMPIRIYACTLNYFMAWWSHIGFFKAISLNPYIEFKENLENLYIQKEPFWISSRSNYIW